MTMEPVCDWLIANHCCEHPAAGCSTVLALFQLAEDQWISYPLKSPDARRPGSRCGSNGNKISKEEVDDLRQHDRTRRDLR